ncbi:MAG: tRNA (adenosine(37)-N6)-dimethylallyltransferase MiaA [bacterium]|nr:tRNA (adenosine(37)-N6)-dimethylallyltransferase MiaA [Candidatus Microgenomates bacterium CPR3]MCQ3944457.1 tRNA (adenosine(37)-N6)-dimethylallyltransferase MiaA [bacterium]RIK51780.1 MAG: tRNA (adenosine(37)-N6)-dimethylallyltransferase MiaA [Candidatus Microgenomates bacterium]
MGAIFVVGTTGTGKTKLAVMLANKSPGSLVISADSRQVYREMDVVTGKDHPKNIDIKGINLVGPNQDFSVSQWYDTVKPLYDKAQDAGRQVIVVGGTGFYVRALTSGIETLVVPINPELRAKLEKLSVGELQEILKQKNISKFNQLNHSDQLNPRRLVRAIEVSSTGLNTTISSVPTVTQPLIGLYYQDLEMQKKVIRERVLARIDSGAIKETENLLSKYGSNIQGISALGYLQIRRYILGEISLGELVELWTLDELRYAKRQLTYFRKQNVIWYDRGRMSIEEIYDHISR